ncbi:MAG: TIGR02301 family protein [Methyloceanibacter sp.]
MGQAKQRFLRLAFGALCAAWAGMAFSPIADAQFFWWFDQPKSAPKPRGVKPKAPGDDLPPIVPRESTAPPPPDDRPYDNKLMRLAEILGAVHYLRELCGAQEGQVWRDQMKDILRNEGTTAVRRAKLVNAFNDGYRGYRRTYRTCTQSATLATTRFSSEGATIAASLAQGSTFASKGGADTKPAPSPDAGKDDARLDANKDGAAPEANKEGATPDAKPEGPSADAASPEATGNVSQSAPEALPAQPQDSTAPVEEPPD